MTRPIDKMSVEELELELAALELEMLEHDALDAARSELLPYVVMRNPEWGEVPWFHQVVARELEGWLADPDPPVLVLTMPPGHSKSTYAREALAWALGRDPTTRVAYVSYNAEKAEAQAAQVVDALGSDTYLSIFPELRTSRTSDVKATRAKDRASVVEIVTPHGEKTGGALLAVGVGGGLTSERVDIIAIDDYLPGPKEARSPTIRADHKRWYVQVAESRKRPGRPIRVVIVNTRWHLDDLVGWLKVEDPDGIREVRFQGVRTPAESHPEDPREDGEALWPLVKTVEQYARTRRLDPEGYACVDQGDPVPEGGALYKLKWFKGERQWEVLPDTAGTWIQSWDFRHGGRGASSSWAVGQLWFRPEGRATAYLVDQVRGRWGPGETEVQFEAAQMRPMWARAGKILVERKADGVNILDKYSEVYPGMTEVMPTADKLTRARGTVGFCAAGNVRVPLFAEWLAEWFGEVTAFTGHGDMSDDQVDAMSQALDELFMREHGRAATADEIVEMQTQMLEELEGGLW